MFNLYRNKAKLGRFSLALFPCTSVYFCSKSFSNKPTVTVQSRFLKLTVSFSSYYQTK